MIWKSQLLPGATDGWIELGTPGGGCTIALHQASVAQKSGTAMKLVFGVADVRAFKAAGGLTAGRFLRWDAGFWLRA